MRVVAVSAAAVWPPVTTPTIVPSSSRVATSKAPAGEPYSVTSCNSRSQTMVLASIQCAAWSSTASGGGSNSSQTSLMQRGSAAARASRSSFSASVESTTTQYMLR